MTHAKLWVVGLIAVALGAGCKGRHAPLAEDVGAAAQVKVIHPRKGALARLCIQPGSVHTFESVRLFAKVPGFLKFQDVDIGAHVVEGSLLALVDVPDIEAQVERNLAAVEKTKSQYLQMKSRVDVAQANLKALQATVSFAVAKADSAKAWVKYRKIQLGRMEELALGKNIEQRLVDESLKYYEAAVETENAAKAEITSANANVVAGNARIKQAEADVLEAEAEIKVAKAELKRSEVDVDFASITAPFHGVITYRGMNKGDFVRAANSGASIEPLLTIDRTDKFRVVVLVPDRDVAFIKEGKPAIVEIDSLPGQKFKATVSRIAESLDLQTRLMRVELDMPNNDKGQIYHGMYGQVTIVLEKGTNLLSIPTSCLAIKAEKGHAMVYVVRSGKVAKVQVDLGMDTGLRVAVLEGLTTDDQVILNPGGELAEQSAVTAALWDEAKAP